MNMTPTVLRPRLPMTPRRAQAGISLVELMVAITLGLLLMAGLAALFANSSATRNEIERASRQIENGRFAVEVLSDDLRLAGFYGELNVPSLGAPGGLQDPCSIDPAAWSAAIPYHVQGYDNGTGMPGCVPGDHKAGTDVLVVRRVSSCEAGVAGCAPAQAPLPYIQVTRCEDQAALAMNSYRLGRMGEVVFDRQLKSCSGGALAPLRQYFVRVYYVSTDNGSGQAVPTLKRLDFTGSAFTVTPLVEGIEELNIEYGIDWNGDGTPDGYTTDPATYNPPACAGACNPADNWVNAMTTRISLLARNIEPSPNYTDNKTYSLGYDAAGAPVEVTPADAYRRHVYSSLVRIVNAAQRRDTP